METETSEARSPLPEGSDAHRGPGYKMRKTKQQTAAPDYRAPKPTREPGTEQEDGKAEDAGSEQAADAGADGGKTSPASLSNGENNGRRLIPQPHGGALLPGGTVGNAGGPGRPTSDLRRMAGVSYEQHNRDLDMMAKIVKRRFRKEAKKKDPDDEKLLRMMNTTKGAADQAGKYSMGTINVTIDNMALLKIMLDVLRRHLDPDQMRPISADLKEAILGQ